MKIIRSKNHYFGLNYIATGKETNGKYFLSETTIPARDNGPPLHSHSREDESFYLRIGQLTFTIDGKTIELNEGEFLNIERGEKHTWRNESDIEAKLIVTFAPAGIEKMFIELENNMSDIKDIGRKYGTEFEL